MSRSVSMKSDDILMGVDGGATKVAAHHVSLAVESKQWLFKLGAASATRAYSFASGFTPIPIAEQLEQRNRGHIRLEAGERVVGQGYVCSAAEAILETLSSVATARPVWLGVGMPGLKTADGRGIDAMNNGPRIPDYLDQLEAQLRMQGVELAAPVRRLGSDADYCGRGEEFGEGGCFRGVKNAYYVGGGSGLADALKLDHRLIPFDQVKSWILKSWQISSEQGRTFEKLVAPKSMNALFAAAAPSVAAHSRIEQAAESGNEIARTLLQDAARALAELVFERMHTLLRGRMAMPHHDSNYRDLEEEHPFREKTFGRIVIGQVLGVLFQREGVAPWFRKPFQQSLVDRIHMCGSQAMNRAYLTHGTLRDDLIVVSELRAAPALGAAIDAVLPQEPNTSLLIKVSLQRQR